MDKIPNFAQQPLYTINQSVKRIVLSTVLKLLILAAVFFGGIYLNLILLQITLTLFIAVTTISILLVLVIIQTVITPSQVASNAYAFYQDHIEFHGFKKNASITFQDIQNISYKRNLLDKVCNTGTINIDPGFKIASIEYSDQVHNYAQQLVNQYRNSYNQYTGR